MDTFELKKEQLKLAPKIELKDNFSTIRTLGGAACYPFADKLIACVVVCAYPSLEVIEKQISILDNPLPFKSGYKAYREMPAIIEAYNQLEEEPDVLLVHGAGIAHPRGIGSASHIGLVLNTPTIGVSGYLLAGKVENGKIMLFDDVKGFEVKTHQYAKPLYVSPGHSISLGSVLRMLPKMVQPPHKMPEPLHIAAKIAKKKGKMVVE